jgi:hypothetical protein
MNNGFETCSAQGVHACTKSTYPWQDYSISRGSNTSIGSEHSIGPDTF